MLKFTSMSCQRDSITRKIEGFASINVEINDFGAMKMQVSCYDAYESAFSKFLSKLPIVRNSNTITDFQNRLSVAIDNILNGGDLVVGFYKRDITMFNQLLREFRKSNLNNGKSILDVNRPVRELAVETSNKITCSTSYDIAEHHNVDMTIVQELACIVFGVDYYAELPICTIRAALYCCIKMQEEGYDLEDVLLSCTEYMTLVETNKDHSSIVVSLPRRSVSTAII